MHGKGCSCIIKVQNIRSSRGGRDSHAAYFRCAGTYDRPAIRTAAGVFSRIQPGYSYSPAETGPAVLEQIGQTPNFVHALKNNLHNTNLLKLVLVGGRILAAIQANGNRVFGIPMYGQQFLSGISFIALVALTVYVYTVVARMKRID